ncbi:MAG TPA: hypothetical protein DDY37_07410 [Legionella sp.]|nr:hypothetical protein [Legionella sp.]
MFTYTLEKRVGPAARLRPQVSDDRAPTIEALEQFFHLSPCRGAINHLHRSGRHVGHRGDLRVYNHRRRVRSREPYQSKLSPYLAAIKRIPPSGSADMACRMAA